MANVQPESPQIVSVPCTDLPYIKRQLVNELNAIKSCVYHSNNINILSTTKEILAEIKESLVKSVPRQGGLPLQSDRIRKLPTRKKYFKSNRKFYTRVGRGACIRVIGVQVKSDVD